MTPLPVISCDNCGVCCTTIGTPPGYAVFFPIGDQPIPQWALDSEDCDYFCSAPPEAIGQLAHYYARVWAGEVDDRTARDDLPCLWYDPETRKCKHHEHRPSVCREFEVGGEDCLRMRKEAGVDAP